MKTTYEVSNVTIDPNEVKDVQVLHLGYTNQEIFKIIMLDESSVVVPAPIYAIMRKDIETSLTVRMLMKSIDKATKTLHEILNGCSNDPIHKS